MAQTPSVLQELHTYLLRIRSINEELDAGPRRLKKLQNKVAAAEKALADHLASIKATRVAINDRDVSLKANAELIKKYQRDLDNISSKKEFDALNVEIAGLKKRNSDLEDEGLQLMGQVEEANGKTAGFEAAIAQAKTDYTAAEADYQTQLPAWHARLAEAKKFAAEKRAMLDEKWQKPFERQEHNEGADALAALVGKSCSSCYTGVTAQQYALISSNMIEACKNCGKLLYLEV